MIHEQTQPGDRLLELDPGRFDPRKIVGVIHRLEGHPLLEIPGLLELSRRLKPPGVMNYISGKTSIESDFTGALKTHGSGRSLEETLAHIEEPGSWVAFYHVESDPLYRELVDACL